MHGSILVLAKKKAAGPGGYFDPMQGPAPMAMGPMVFQVSEEPEAPESEDEGEDEKGGYDVPTAGMAKGSPSMDLKSIIADLKRTAAKLDQLAMSGGEMEAEDEPTGEEPMPEAAPSPKAKKPFPGFGAKKEMKY
jgi:hypothetical protein